MREYREWRTWLIVSKRVYPYARELLSNEIYVLVSAIAMNALLAFFPFVILLVSVSARFFRSWQVHTMTYEILRQYLPVGQENQDLVIRILHGVEGRFDQVQFISLVILMWSIANVFIPLEMALNRAWGVAEARGFWRSQRLALMMVAIAVVLSFGFIAAAAFSKYLLIESVFSPEWRFTQAFLQFIIIKVWMVPLTVAMFYVIFYIVPNTEVGWKEVLPAAVFTGLLWEISNYLFVLVVPWLGLRDIYGGFIVTVTLMMWAYVGGIVLVFGANLTAKRVFAARSADPGDGGNTPIP